MNESSEPLPFGAGSVGEVLIGSTLVLTIQAQHRRNSLSAAVRQGLHAGLARADDEAGVRAVVITAEGRTFSSGGDFIEDFGPLASGSRGDAWEVVGGYFRLFDHIERCRVPVIAAVNGPAIGGGLEVIMASDLAVAVDTATFAPIEGRAVGTPSGWTLLRAAERLDHKVASELLLTGSIIDAETALSWGLVNRLVPPDELMSAALRWGEAIAGVSAHAVNQSKRYLREQARTFDADVVRELVVEAFATQESKDAIAGFFTKPAEPAP